jgi:hypothetical protein
VENTVDAELDDTELMAAIGRMVVNAALLEYSVAQLIAITEGLEGEECRGRATQIAKTPGEAMRQFKRLAEKRQYLDWPMRDTEGLLRARHFVAHSVTQQPAIAEGHAALFVLHPKTGETMITTTQAINNARLIREGYERIRDAIATEITGDKPAPRYLRRQQ